LISNDGMIVTLSNRGYIKRTAASEYRVQARGGKGVKGMVTQKASDEAENDFVEHLFTAQAHDYLMFFTNTGRVYVERVYGLPEGSRASKGRSIKNVLDLSRRRQLRLFFDSSILLMKKVAMILPSARMLVMSSSQLALVRLRRRVSLISRITGRLEQLRSS
jgi:DNA gyrase/topoisomerase IV subunit A